MKKNYRLFLSVLLCVFLMSPSWAQQENQPVYMGKSKEVFDRISHLSDPALRVTGKPTLFFNLPSGATVNVDINYQKSSAEGQYIIGKVENAGLSDFFLKATLTSIEGNIVLRDTKKAYRFYSDIQGNAYLEETDINDVVCIQYENAPAGTGTSSGAASASVYELQSFPGANGCVLLDFDGQNVSGTPWNNGNPINAQPSGMSDAAIQQAWEVVTEDYRPFNINITTSEAVFNTYPKNRRMRCIITPTNTAAPGSGGVAYLNSFTWNDDTPCWVFILSGKSCGEAASHEVGHTLSLSHDGRTSPQEDYYAGQGNWAPIMGVGYYKTITQWSKGEYANSNNKEDDLAKIVSSSNGLGYRTDDHGNSLSTATALVTDAAGNVDASSNTGLIERNTDVDMFRFTTSGGNISLTISPAARYADLDILATLYDASGTVLGTYNPTGLATSISTSVAAGTYYISIDGTGEGNPATTGYSDYASLGYFSISGTIPAGAANQQPVVSITSPSGGASFAAPATISITANASDSDGSVALVEFFNGSTKLGEDATAPYSFSWTNVAAGSYSLTARATDNGGLQATSAAVVIQVTSTPANQPPVVNLASPVNGATYVAPATINITANASDSDGSVTLVEFFNGSTKLGEDASAPYSFSWTNVAAGSYVITARATDNAGAQTTSSGITVRVTSPANQSPVVSITAPANGASFAAPATISISANATDSDGSVALVEFFNGTTKLGEDASAPYSFTWSNVPAGSYALSARATDNAGAQTTSATVNVTVTTPSAYCASKGSSTRYEYINKIALGSINNTSGSNGGYGDFTNLTTSLSPGASYSIYFTPGFSGSAYYEYWGIWIDYNGDGDFEDSGERLVNGRSSGSSTYYTTFTVPTSAKTGRSRLRVSMKYGSTPGSCETFSYGEVEDYAVDISATQAALTASSFTSGAMPLDENTTAETGVILHPNPVQNVLNIDHLEAEKGATARITDMNGSVVKTFEISRTSEVVNVSDLPAGVYVVIIRSGRNETVKRFVKL